MFIKVILTLLVGAQCESMLDDVAKKRIETFKEYPFLYKGNMEQERAYLKVYTQEQAVIVKATVDEELAGFITGVPFKDSNFNDGIDAFKQHDMAPEEFYYVGEIIVDPEFRKKKIATNLFATLENHAQEKDYKNFCLVGIEHEEGHPLKPSDYEDTDIFCQKMGYTKTEIKVPHHYPTICADGSVKDIENTFVFWTKVTQKSD